MTRSVAPTPTPVSTTASNTSKTKFPGTQYAGVSYQIFPGPLSDAAKVAITGFDLKTNPQPDASTEVDLIYKVSGYTSQTYSVKPGYTLYFIERSSSDDATDTDASTADDSGVLVDPQGFIAQ